MTGIKSSRRRAAASLLISSITMLPLAGCGSNAAGTSAAGSPGFTGASTASQAPAPSATNDRLFVSPNSAAPGTLINITRNLQIVDGSFDPNQKATVKFVLPDGRSLEMPATAITSDSLTVAAPFVPSGSGLETQAVEVRLYVVQGEGPNRNEFGPSPLMTVSELPILALAPGTVLIRTLDQLIGSTLKSRENWIAIALQSQGSFDASRIVASLESEVASLTKIREIIQRLANGEVDQIPLGTFQGQPIVLTQDLLAFLDRLLVVYQPTAGLSKQVLARGNLASIASDMFDSVNIAFALVSAGAIIASGGTAIPLVVQGYFYFGAVAGSVVALDAASRRVNPFIENFRAAVELGSQIPEKLSELGSAVAASLETSTGLPDFEFPGFVGTSELWSQLQSIRSGARSSLPTETEQQQLSTAQELLRRPDAIGDRYNLNNDRELQVGEPGILSNDFPKGGQITSYQSTSLRGGSVVLNQSNGRFTYVAPEGFNGEDRWSYQVTNTAGSDSAEVVIGVTGNTGNLPLQILPSNPSTSCSIFFNQNGFLDVDSRTIQFATQNAQGPLSWSSTAGEISSGGLLRVGRSQGTFTVTASDNVGQAATNVTIVDGMLTLEENSQVVVNNQLVATPPLLDFSLSGASLSLVNQTIRLDGLGRPSGGVSSIYRCSAPLLEPGDYYTLEVSNRNPVAFLVFSFGAFGQFDTPSGGLQPLGSTANGGMPTDRATLRFGWRAVTNSN